MDHLSTSFMIIALLACASSLTGLGKCICVLDTAYAVAFSHHSDGIYQAY